MTQPDEGFDDPRLVAEGELGLARLALDDGELQHAASHLANAFATLPTLPEAHELLAVLVSAPGGGPDLWSVEDDVYVGSVVARAHALAQLRDYTGALNLLCAAQKFRPVTPWADVAWVVDPAVAARLTPSDLTQWMMMLIGLVDEPCRDELRPAMTPYLTLSRNAVAAHPDDPLLAWIASVMVRRMGYAEEAAALADRSERLEPSDRAAIAHGYALRALGRTDDALAAWDRALRFDPHNLELYADISSLLAGDGRLDEALAWNDRALAIDPAHDCSVISGCRLRYQRDRNVDELVRIADLHGASEPGSHPSQHAADTLTESSRGWWLGVIPAASESVIDVLDQVFAAGSDTQGGTLTVSSLEPPSAMLAFDRALPGYTVTVEQIPEPDPRWPVTLEGSPAGAVTGVLWSYTGADPRPTVSPPTKDGADTVAFLARSQWDSIPAAYDEALLLAGVSIDDLAGVMVHPPAPPSGRPGDWPGWIRAVQVWACLGLAHQRAAEPWETSIRRRILLDLAYGPEDWITEAACFALTATAWVRPATRTDVAEVVGWRFVAAVDAYCRRPVSIVPSLATLVLTTPAMSESVRSLADDVLRR